MKLTPDEQAMLDGDEGPGKQKAMDLLVRYGEALGAERFVDTNNVAGVPGSATAFLQNHYKDSDGGYDAIFSHFDLDSDEVVDIPQAEVHACHLQGGVDPENWEALGKSQQDYELSRDSEAYAEAHGVKILKTCTPYIVGEVPQMGEHCAWMESSAVVFCNSVLGARTNTEGRESTSAVMLTGKIPDFGLHRAENRFGTHRINVEIKTESIRDWGMLGYFAGDFVQEDRPVITGDLRNPDLHKHKHFGAAAASSGGVEMYHIVGATPEAPTLEAVFGPNTPVETVTYGKEEQRRVYDALNANGSDTDADFVMLGCPHSTLEQVEEACRLLDGKRISGNCRLWIFTSRDVRRKADQMGYTKIIRDAGGMIFTDTCSAIGSAVPPNTKVAALDSAKQAHYLPAMMGVEAWFGTTAECINAAITGRWNGERP